MRCKRYRLIVLVFGAIFLLNLTSYSQNKREIDSVDSYFKNRMQHYNIPGMAACIVTADSIYWSNAYGWANPETEDPFTVNTIMNVASISKTVTATAVMQLWERKLLKLDEDINNYLPFSVRNPNHPGKSVTIRQLLMHTSSLIDGPAYTKSYSCGDPILSLKFWVENNLVEEGVYYSKSENFLPNEPGTTYSYSNIAYGLLGYIVEEISKTSFQDYCRKKIFAPLKMESTGWFINEIDETKHARPNVYVDADNQKYIADNFGSLFPGTTGFQLNNQYVACVYSFPNYPDGGLRTSVKDLSRFLSAYINGGVYKNARILKKSTVEMMLPLQIENNNSQGLCWHNSEYESLWGHGGADPGVRTQMFFSIESRTGMIVFQNNNRGDSFEWVKMLYQTTK